MSGKLLTSTVTRPTVGFVGLGVMGQAMAANLLRAGFPIVVHNRTRAKAKALLAAGARWGVSPAAVAKRSDVVIVMLADPAAVEAVVCGARGVAAGLRRGVVLIDMSTVTPSTSRRLGAVARAAGASFLDAPVVGSKGPAEKGELVIVVGGAAAALERCRPVLASLGKRIVHAGAVGQGSALKLVMNLVLSHLMLALSEGMVLGAKAGLDAEAILSTLEASTFATPWYRSKATTMMARNFSTHFALKHMYKDTRLMLELAHELAVPMPVTSAIKEAFGAARAQGKGELDYSVVVTWLEELAGVTLGAPARRK